MTRGVFNEVAVLTSLENDRKMFFISQFGLIGNTDYLCAAASPDAICVIETD